MKSFLVIGMGRFGRHLATRLAELKNDVMIADWDAAIIDELAPLFTDAQIGDCTNPTVLNSFGVEHFDACFVTIGENFQSSLEITSLLKELGAKHVVAKANRDIQAKFLLRNGADEVVYPERDIAHKLATRHNAKNILDYIELAPDCAIFEIPVPRQWVGKSIAAVNVRRKYNLNVLMVKNNGQVQTLPTPDYIFSAEDTLFVVGNAADVMRLN